MVQDVCRHGLVASGCAGHTQWLHCWARALNGLKPWAADDLCRLGWLRTLSTRQSACPCRANDLPFARNLGVPYEEFLLNIQPDDYTQLNGKVQRILDSPKRLRHMQVTLHTPQPFWCLSVPFEWGRPFQQHGRNMVANSLAVSQYTWFVRPPRRTNELG